MESHLRLDFGALLPGVGVFGGVRRFLSLGNELVRRGHRYVLYHPDGTPPGWLPFHGEVRRLASLGDSAHDVLLCGEPSLLPDFAAAPARAKLFYVVLEGLPGERRLVRDPRWGLLANSTGIAARLRRRHGVEAHLAAGGIDLGLFHPGATPRPARPEPFRVLAYGRLSRPRKGTRIAVRAAEALATRAGRRLGAAGTATVHSVQLVLFDHVGPGNERDPRPELGCRVPVEFHLNLPQERLAALYAGCDVFVSAERRAGWNNTVAEAMACGTPVVCTSSGTRDLALHLQTAWVVRWRHPWPVARALRRIHGDAALRQRLSVAGRGRVGDFTWDRVADAVEAAARGRLRGS